MASPVVEKLILTSVVAVFVGLGKLAYTKYFKKPVVDFTTKADDLGEDSPVIEALLAMRARYSNDGNRAKALEYSTKALAQCPTSVRIKELNDLDKENTSHQR